MIMLVLNLSYTQVCLILSIFLLTCFIVIYKMYLALEQKKCSKTKTTQQQRLLASRCSTKR